MTALESSSWITGELRTLINKELWAWIKAHENDEVFVIRFWVITKTLRWRDLEPAVTALIGPAPTDYTV